MELSNRLDADLRILRAAYPDGVPEAEYLPLLAVLSADMSEEYLGVVIARLRGGDSVVVVNDAAAALSSERPPGEEVRRVQAKLEAAGWEFSDDK